jgi:hypothetical protein
VLIRFYFKNWKEYIKNCRKQHDKEFRATNHFFRKTAGFYFKVWREYLIIERADKKSMAIVFKAWKDWAALRSK